MLNIYDESRPSRVTVAFEDKALSFMLSKDATFEDLADRLDCLGERYHGKVIAIEVKFAAAFDAQRLRAAPPQAPSRASPQDIRFKAKGLYECALLMHNSDAQCGRDLRLCPRLD
jgi:hypothetical protein